MTCVEVLMPRRFTAFLCLVASCAALAACNPSEERATASPSPVALASAGSAAPLSLSDALPSPTPDATLPSMPPEVPGAFLFYEDFEKGWSRWKASGGAGPVGFHHLKAATCGGLYTMVLGEPKNPPTTFAAAEAFLTLRKPIDLAKAKHAQLQFDLKGHTNPPDAASITAEARTPGGEWKAIAPRATARFPLVVTFTADLAPWVGKAVELRFRGATKPAAQPTKGFYLDDVHVVEKVAP